MKLIPWRAEDHIRGVGDGLSLLWDALKSRHIGYIRAALRANWRALRR